MTNILIGLVNGLIIEQHWGLTILTLDLLLTGRTKDISVLRSYRFAQYSALPNHLLQAQVLKKFQLVLCKGNLVLGLGFLGSGRICLTFSTSKVWWFVIQILARFFYMTVSYNDHAILSHAMKGGNKGRTISRRNNYGSFYLNYEGGPLVLQVFRGIPVETMRANLNKTQVELPAEYSGQNGAHVSGSNVNAVLPPLNTPNQDTYQGPVGILWDIENCPVPSDVRPEDVAGNIRMALRVHPIIKGAVTMFSAYGDFNAFPRRVREGCQRTGVKLIDVPNGRKDAADKAILIDMFLFALDNRPPSSIMLISGDVDFSPALHILGQRGYTVILAIPSGVGVSSALTNAGRFVWDWSSVARGEGFVPRIKTPMALGIGPIDVAGYLMGCRTSDTADVNEEEAIVYQGNSQNCYNPKDFSVVSEYTTSTSVALPCFTAALRSQSLPPGLNEVTACSSASIEPTDVNWWVQPGDVPGLKGQLVKLLELSGGCLPLSRIPAEYQKLFGRPLYIAEYGAFKLVYLLKKMSDAMAVQGKGQKKFVYLRHGKAVPSAPPLLLSRKDKKGKGTQEGNVNVNIGCGSSDEISDEERIFAEGHEREAVEKSNSGAVARLEMEDKDLQNFKHELQEILVCYSCRIFLSCFEAIYRQRYKRPLDYQALGVNCLEELFDKVGDVATLQQEPGSNRTFLAAVGLYKEY